jgi:AraC-like DNA-binding protein
MPIARNARALGCSERSLTRATREVVGMSAKELVTARLVLEARRRLAHSTTPVARISDDLGFSEATNFVKFFRRETRTTPRAFRTTQRFG